MPITSALTAAHDNERKHSQNLDLPMTSKVHIELHRMTPQAHHILYSYQSKPISITKQKEGQYWETFPTKVFFLTSYSASPQAFAPKRLITNMITRKMADPN